MHDKQTAQRGFTLIEIAIVTIIASFVVFSFVKVFHQYSEKVALEETEEAISFIRSGLNTFLQRNGRYPCPARIDASPDDADYGWELDECDDPLTPGIVSDPTELNLSNPIDIDGDPATTEDRILIGAVPIYTLEPCLKDPNLSCSNNTVLHKHAYDGWNSKLTYAVSEILTKNETYSRNGGTISVEDENRTSVIDPPGKAHFVIISHGSDRRGAFNMNGEQVQDNCRGSVSETDPDDVTPFPTNPAGRDEKDNCDHDDEIFVNALKNDSDDPTRFYDDIIFTQVTQISNIWDRTDVRQMTNSNLGNVGVGDFGTPGNGRMPEAPLHVIGDMQAIDIYADQLCDDENFCFTPSFLGGPPDKTYDGNGATDPTDFQNTCANPGEAVYKISENHVSCRPVFTNPLQPGKCNTAAMEADWTQYEVMVGYSNDTGIICQKLYR